MSYIRADQVLPKELIEAIQQYVSGKNLYIPCREKEPWGTRTETRQYYRDRNARICQKRERGISVQALAEEYSLSEKSIQRILRNASKDNERKRR